MLARYMREGRTLQVQLDLAALVARADVLVQNLAPGAAAAAAVGSEWFPSVIVMLLAEPRRPTSTLTKLPFVTIVLLPVTVSTSLVG